ncbi:MULTISPECIES: FliC/FljB family flagellin [Halomonas]|uniref:FliC/FljB family flagellin n=1 Tax=Halomonas TaxID=2745 RepID=UPI001C96D485|nr:MULTISPECIES: FliC/FljB family flagellin [Halomonas]MBY5983383.1 FliC/FljB family flagellin [Halomonas sp. DP5Y7-2]MBY6206185.1 FliC/FljB family flagellin [Halomonas sp. DP3Y7-2]MBY6227924.1 FliC/FljB family flagellin [Halomonas sp. DP3Y7-1]MCA0915991.1 FliC/FljB family flagellin [Halomonas denitrificans]
MSVINTNITSMIGQQNLNRSQNALATSMERLSSGLRINSAKDDAAGQAIANRMSAQITGLSQAQRNANDGISVAQTAEGALNQVNDNLQRIRELSVQAQNDTNSADDLNSIQKEIDQRLTEIDRISDETSFNGVKVLAKDQDLTIQVGANDNETITIDLDEINSETLSLDSFNVNGTAGTPAAGAATTLATDFDLDTSGTTTAASFTGLATGQSVVKDSDGDYYLQVAATGGNPTTFYALDENDVSINAADNKISITLDTSKATGVTQAATTDPLEQLDSALSQVDTLRSDLGAIQNRFESAITNLSTTETNLSAARSRIEDADYAVEVANMTRAQILQQAGTSVLAQANQVPQGVLSLLG